MSATQRPFASDAVEHASPAVLPSQTLFSSGGARSAAASRGPARAATQRLSERTRVIEAWNTPSLSTIGPRATSLGAAPGADARARRCTRARDGAAAVESAAQAAYAARVMRLQLPSFLALATLAACGPGKNDSADPTESTSSASTTSEPTSAGPTATEGPTTGLTTDADSSGASTGAQTPCGDTLPPEGAPCAPDGADCAPDADPCNPYTGAMCNQGMWTYYEVGPGDPMTCGGGCDPFPTEGQSCSMEGSSCSSGCEEQCSFCNIVTCEGGTWMNMEVFPAPCLSCEELCPFVTAAACPGGPPDVAACVAGCMSGTELCPPEFSDVRACAGLNPTFSCDELGRPTVVGCETDFDALYACLGP